MMDSQSKSPHQRETVQCEVTRENGIVFQENRLDKIWGRNIEIQYRFLFHFHFGRHATQNWHGLGVGGFALMLQNQSVVTITPFSVHRAHLLRAPSVKNLFTSVSPSWRATLLYSKQSPAKKELKITLLPIQQMELAHSLLPHFFSPFEPVV